MKTNKNSKKLVLLKQAKVAQDKMNQVRGGGKWKKKG